MRNVSFLQLNYHSYMERMGSEMIEMGIEFQIIWGRDEVLDTSGGGLFCQSFTLAKGEWVGQVDIVETVYLNAYYVLKFLT